MSSIFLPGPFGETDMLRAILGPECGSPPLRPAALSGHALFVNPHGAELALRPTRVPSPTGFAADAAPAAAERLEFALAAFSGARGPTSVETTDGRRSGRISRRRSEPAAPVSTGCEPEWRAHLVEVALEAMGQFGRRPAAEIPALMQGISYRALGRVRGAADASPVRLRSGLLGGGRRAGGAGAALCELLRDRGASAAASPVRRADVGRRRTGGRSRAATRSRCCRSIRSAARCC